MCKMGWFGIDRGIGVARISLWGGCMSSFVLLPLCFARLACVCLSTSIHRIREKEQMVFSCNFSCEKQSSALDDLLRKTYTSFILFALALLVGSGAGPRRRPLATPVDRGHPRSLKIGPLDRTHTSSFMLACRIVTMTLSCTFSEI